MFRGFCFTLNNPIEGNFDAIKDLPKTKYGIVGREVGASGTPHLQGYLYFVSKRSNKAVIKELTKLFGKQPHVEAAKGGPAANKAYCSKEKDFYEWGELPAKGKRTDLTRAAELLKSGSAMSAVAEEMPGTYIRYHRGLAAYQGLHLKDKSKAFREVEVIFITGPTGSGKTRMAMEEAQYKITGAGLQWWDGYEGEEIILIDEYANQLKLPELLTILDGYQLRLPIKGGFTYACWKKVFITSNLKDLHEQALPAHREALQRRITKTIDLWPKAKKRKFSEMLSDDFVFN